MGTSGQPWTKLYVGNSCKVEFKLYRKSCLMEDEGHDELVGEFQTMEQAQAALGEYIERAHGFFVPANMEIRDVKA